MKKTLKKFLWLFVCLIFALVSANQVLAQTKIGVLVIAHGSSNGDWNRYVKWGVEDIKLPFPVKSGFLESAGPTIPEAVSALETEGVDEIVAIPLFISSQSGHMEEIKYILGLRADNPSKKPLQKIDGGLPIKLTSAVDDHPFAVKILADRVWGLERSLNRADLSLSGTYLILIGHGEKGDYWEGLFGNLSHEVANYLGDHYSLSFKGASYIFLSTLKGVKDYCAKNDCKIDDTCACFPVFIAPGFLTDKLIPGYLDEIKKYAKGIKIFYKETPLLPSKYVSKIVETKIAETITPLIKIHENGQLKEINTIQNSIEDNDKICLGHLFTYKAFQFALNQLKNENYIPQKGSLEAYTKQTTDGAEGALEDLVGTVRQASKDPRYLTAEDFYYEFMDHNLKKKVSVQVKPEVFSQGFFDLRTKIKTGKASSKEIKEFKQLRAQLEYRLLWSWQDPDLRDLFKVETSNL